MPQALGETSFVSVTFLARFGKADIRVTRSIRQIGFKADLRRRSDLGWLVGRAIDVYGPVRTFEPGARHDGYQPKAALIEVSDKRPPDTACCGRRDNWRDAIEKDQSWTIAHLCRRTAVQGSDRETRGA